MMGGKKTELQALAKMLLAKVEHLANTGGEEVPRILVGIAGAPGSGKSTFCDSLDCLLNAASPGVSAVFAMDGFHFDDIYLKKMGWLAKKGAPHTFDVLGFIHTLKRLKANNQEYVGVPVFDRELEIARAGARIISHEAKIVLVEGNYLLLNQPPWNSIAKQLDLSVMLNADMKILQKRLGKRWGEMGMSTSQIEDKLEGNDLPNVRLVMQHSGDADYQIWTDEPG